MRAGLENLVIPDEKAVERAYKTAKHGSLFFILSFNAFF